MKVKVLVLAFLFMVFGVSGASAATIGLYDWAFNVNGTSYESLQGTNNFSILPSYFNYASFDQATGLGTIVITYKPSPGAYKITAFFDHEIDETINTFFNEYGTTFGTPGAGQTWQLDDPLSGTIYSNTLAGTLNDTNSVVTPPQDVSMAMGWNFTLGSGEYAVITLRIATTPPSGFYLQQTDPDSQANINYGWSLNITGGGEPPIPEPATMLLLGSGLVGLAGLGRKRLLKK